MHLYLALFLVGLCLWEKCVAFCPDGSVSPLKCNPFHHFVCPEGYRCFGSPKGGQCCLDRSFSDYTCPGGRHPYLYGIAIGLYRCNGIVPNSGICPAGYFCKAVEQTRTRIGICCPHL